MKRRTLLQSLPATAGLAGFTGIASAADCNGVSEWDEMSLYMQGDQVTHPDSDGAATLWEADIASRNAEPSGSSPYWSAVGPCGSGGSTNEAPTASFTTSMSTPAPGEDVTFDASGSSDPDGSIESYAWEFGDGSTFSGQTGTYSYDSTGDYTVTLTVTDNDGATDTTETTVSVSSESSNAAPNASFTVSPTNPTVGESVSLDAADSSDSDGTIETFAWDFGDGTTVEAESGTHSYDSAGDYTITLTVTDDDGATDTNSTTITVASDDSGSGSGVDCSGVQAYDPSATYTGGDQVVYDGSLWTAEWWTRGTAPAESENVWTLEGSCSSGSGGSDDGSDDGGNSNLNAVIEASDTRIDVGGEVTLDASSSEGEIETYEWTVGETGPINGAQNTITLDEEGSYDVTLTVIDADGNEDSTTRTVFVGTAGGANEKRVVAYYRQWAQYDREYVPGDIPLDKVTHLQYAFARPEKDGSINLVGQSFGQQAFYDGATGEYQEFGEGPAFADLAANNDDTKFVLSIGGWGDSEYFSDAALTEETRTKFANQCLEWIERGNLDGIDIDWEFPHGGGCQGNGGEACNTPNNSRDGDIERFTLLCQKVREVLDEAAAEDPDRDEPYEVTAAVNADPEAMADYEHDKLSNVLDFILVMTFDYAGNFSEYTRHHSPLMENPDDPFDRSDEWNASYALSWFEQQGWDPSQLNMAVPFYGRSWSDIQDPDGSGNGTDDGLFQGFEGTGSQASGQGTFGGIGGVYEYYDLAGGARGGSSIIDGDQYETYIDEDAMTAYSYDDSGSGEVISHDTKETMRMKAQWLRDSPYGGTMLWAIGGDTKSGELITTLYDTLKGQ